ncbi:hypothetical protein M1B72_08940 [Geomonas paludis]|uniref:Uncharacterized protein n=1 Tax=Geomonas paludis TaxID=2740185 RepID=A0ABY4LJV8_9BACT|nr:hypothetical protein [Geomonas paludis]UPU37815.1 hypothetical protein M1B72_08940 [Geomonas paludis]
MKWTPVLELGSEGGCIVLEGRQDARGPWFFKFRADERAIEEDCFSKAAEGPAEPRASEEVKGLDAALERLGDRYLGWADLYPVFVHRQFSAQICRTALPRSTYSTFRWQEIADSLYFMASPIASAQEFEKALYGLCDNGGLSDTDIKMLTAQYRARHSTITATALAKAAGFSHYGAANIHYGKLAHRLADRLGFKPPTGSNGRVLYWTTLSYCESESSGEFRFIMRPELAQALKMLGIIKPLQNKVLPTGEIVAASSVGMLMGNRGASAKLHTKDKLLKSQYNPRQVDWKFCTLKAKDGAGNDIQRELMSSKSYTELFFLDEATAFAAGHRPCTCQGRKFYEFIERWVLKNGKEHGVSGKYIRDIDSVITKERIDSDGNKVTYAAVVDGLPDGTMVEYDRKTYLVWGGLLLEWSLGGYVAAIPRPKGQQVRVLTPRSIVNCFGAEYRPEVHPTAGDLTVD